MPPKRTPKSENDECRDRLADFDRQYFVKTHQCLESYCGKAWTSITVQVKHKQTVGMQFSRNELDGKFIDTSFSVGIEHALKVDYLDLMGKMPLMCLQDNVAIEEVTTSASLDEIDTCDGVCTSYGLTSRHTLSIVTMRPTHDDPLRFYFYGLGKPLDAYGIGKETTTNCSLVSIPDVIQAYMYDRFEKFFTVEWRHRNRTDLIWQINASITLRTEFKLKNLDPEGDVDVGDKKHEKNKNKRKSDHGDLDSTKQKKAKLAEEDKKRTSTDILPSQPKESTTLAPLCKRCILCNKCWLAHILPSQPKESTTLAPLCKRCNKFTCLDDYDYEELDVCSCRTRCPECSQEHPECNCDNCQNCNAKPFACNCGGFLCCNKCWLVYKVTPNNALSFCAERHDDHMELAKNTVDPLTSTRIPDGANPMEPKGVLVMDRWGDNPSQENWYYFPDSILEPKDKELLAFLSYSKNPAETEQYMYKWSKDVPESVFQVEVMDGEDEEDREEREEKKLKEARAATLEQRLKRYKFIPGAFAFRQGNLEWPISYIYKFDSSGELT
jgi:hypothetical protein